MIYSCVLGLSENFNKVEISILSLHLTKAFVRILSDLISNSMKSQRRAGLPAGHSVGGVNVPSAGDQRGPERPVLGPLLLSQRVLFTEEGSSPKPFCILLSGTSSFLAVRDHPETGGPGPPSRTLHYSWPNETKISALQKGNASVGTPFGHEYRSTGFISRISFNQAKNAG